MDYKIRQIAEQEYSLLENFLYEAIFVPDGVPARPNQLSSSRNCRYISQTLVRKKMISV